jgi:FixJ family two-component response regulator
MEPSRPIIYLIDDDASVRRSLGRVMASCGFSWQAYASVDEFLREAESIDTGCIVADMTMPDLSGLDLQRALNAAQKKIPLILLTAHDTDEMRAAAHEAGAASFFRKPIDTQALLDAIQWALNAPTFHSST